MAWIYVGYIDISPAMARKIITKHGVTPAEVREACQVPARHETAVWNFHERYGWRVIVVGRTAANRRLKVILQPVDPSDGTWRLRTAVPGNK